MDYFAYCVWEHETNSGYGQKEKHSIDFHLFPQIKQPWIPRVDRKLPKEEREAQEKKIREQLKKKEEIEQASKFFHTTVSILHIFLGGYFWFIEFNWVVGSIITTLYILFLLWLVKVTNKDLQEVFEEA